MPGLTHRTISSLRTRGLRDTWRIIARRMVFHPVCNPWFASAKRIATRWFELRHTEEFDPSYTAFGNYWLDGSRLDRDSVVYSCGVGTQIEFDLAVAERVGCPVWMFDPTPRSVEFMRSHAGDDRLRYQPIGVWTENTTLRFYFDRFAEREGEVRNASVTNLYGRHEFFEAPVATLAAIMEARGHRRLDVLKMDIEGAAIEVLEHALASGIEIEQIVVELERPRTWRGFATFFGRASRLLSSLRQHGYRIHRLPRTAAPYYSIEILALRSSRSKNVGEP